MIASLRFHSGYATGLTGIGRRRIDFSPRLNILFGPNGAGKSTILRTLAAATGCGAGGWSDGRDPTPLPYEITMEWDERPAFYQDCYVNSEDSFLNGDYLERHAHLRSTGEKRIGLVNELIDYIENRFLTYKLPREVRPTLLLDEVDNHIGVAAQSVFWKEIIAQLCKKYQLIIATHSLFPILLRRDNALRQDNLITLEPDYAEICVAELGEAIEYFNARNRNAE